MFAYEAAKGRPRTHTHTYIPTAFNSKTVWQAVKKAKAKANKASHKRATTTTTTTTVE